MQNNPLEDFYRQKEIYITLPTQGRWLSEEPGLSADGELGVKPLSLNDEMLLNAVSYTHLTLPTRSTV